jgi:outer membrane receptor protein involved in Fe transport
MHNSRKWLLGLILATCVFYPNIFVRAQSLNSLSGIVKDLSNAVIPEATITLLNARQAVVASATTDTQGRFTLNGIPSGTYELSVRKGSGFQARHLVVRVPSSADQPLEIKLGPTELSEEITVSADTGIVQNVDRAAQRVNVVTEETLQQRAKAVLAQIADEEAGLSLQRTSPTLGAVVVRGLTEVTVYVDGVRFTNSTQRGGINTFFNLNEPSSLRSVEILRGSNSAQYGSDSLGGTIQLFSQVPTIALNKAKWHGETHTVFNSADLSFGNSTRLTYGSRSFAALGNLAGRRVNTLRPGAGIDSHAAVTRFLGIPSTVFGERLSDTAFTQYSGTFKLIYNLTSDQQFSLHYQRSQQDGGKRSDQLLGGDGNLIADLRNLMLDFFYARYLRQKFWVFDSATLTFSYNSEREERVNQGGQGNPLASMTHEKERTSSFGFSFSLDKQMGSLNHLLVGGDIYRDRVDSPAFSVDPANGSVTITRPRVPNGAEYLLYGFYLQDVFDLLHDRLRLSGALRYNIASYRSRASDSPLVGGQPLWPDDSLRASDISGRVGATLTAADGLNLSFNYSRGFRAPNITSLGSVGLVGVGYQVSAADIAGLQATIGTTADDTAVSTGLPVTQLKSETSNNYDLGIAYRNSWIKTSLTGFVIDINNTITRQTLLLPQGAVGTRLGSQTVERQLASGAVFVPLSPNPVLAQVNFGASRLKGLEYELQLRPHSDWAFNGNYSIVRAEDRETGAPPNLGGAGVPPALGFLSIRYHPQGSRFWIEAYSILAGRQDRLSSLDLSDRRTGATRSRTNIANFFNRGARVRGLIGPGADGRPNTSDDILTVTGETLAQVQRRVLDDHNSAPLFTAIPGYGLIGLRGGLRIKDHSEILIDFENMADKSHRRPGWGIDGPGRGIGMRYIFRF